jgi:hypothetical protein
MPPLYGPASDVEFWNLLKFDGLIKQTINTLF